MNPSQQAIQIQAISRILEGSGSVVDISLPKATIKTKGRPSGASNKPKQTTKDSRTTKRLPSSFEIVEKKRKREEKEDEKNKKKKANPEKPKLRTRVPQKATEKESQEDTKTKKIVPKKKVRPTKLVKEAKPPPPDNLHYRSLLPELIQPFISKTLDVKSDGNCGFRAASYCLGRGEDNYFQIRNELHEDVEKRAEWYLEKNYLSKVKATLTRIKTSKEGPCSKAHWMSMPTTGDLLANAFETPVFFWSTSYSQTFFPHFIPPNNNPPIFLAFLSPLSHFAAVELKDPLHFPAPQVLKQWRISAVPEALAWEEKYSTCFQLTQNLKDEAGASKNRNY